MVIMQEDMNYTITTLASHSCLQILKGAKDEGFATCAIATSDKTAFYGNFKFIDEIIQIETYSRFYSLEEKLKAKNAIVVPHGSFVAYLGEGGDEKISLPYFGNKKVLKIEGDRVLQHEWLRKAKLNLPKAYSQIEEVDKPVIVKLYGAKGGSGYFIAVNKKQLTEKLKKFHFQDKKYFIQEYIIGVPVYLQYFYSPLQQKVELMGIDRRYETNVDGLGRLPSDIQLNYPLEPSYTVIGNFPIVLRESLLPKAYQMADKVVASSKKIIPPKGLIGPFCLETIITPNQEFYCIEISCRIVAGTNLYINGSPYTDLYYGQPMSTGRRIAKEIREAITQRRLDEILD